MLVLTTLAGHADIRSGGLAHAGGPGSTVLVASNERAQFHYSEDNVQMGVRIDTQRIAELWRRVCGREPPGALSSCALLEARRRERWLASVQALRQLLHPDTPPALKAMQLPLAEEMLIMSLFGEQLAEAMPAGGGIAPACVKRAAAFIDECAGQPLTVSAIATAARCSARTLQRAFQQWRGIGVMRYLKEVRLQRAQGRRCRRRMIPLRSRRSRHAGASAISDTCRGLPAGIRRTAVGHARATLSARRQSKAGQKRCPGHRCERSPGLAGPGLHFLWHRVGVSPAGAPSAWPARWPARRCPAS